MIGPNNVATEVQKVHPNSQVCTPITAVMRALEHSWCEKNWNGDTLYSRCQPRDAQFIDRKRV
jgi:hypothetical protein